MLPALRPGDSPPPVSFGPPWPLAGVRVSRGRGLGRLLFRDLDAGPDPRRRADAARAIGPRDPGSPARSQVRPPPRSRARTGGRTVARTRPSGDRGPRHLLETLSVRGSPRHRPTSVRVLPASAARSRVLHRRGDRRAAALPEVPLLPERGFGRLAQAQVTGTSRSTRNVRSTPTYRSGPVRWGTWPDSGISWSRAFGIAEASRSVTRRRKPGL